MPAQKSRSFVTVGGLVLLALGSRARGRSPAVVGGGWVSSGVRATLIGGPCTLPGTGISNATFGGETLRSMRLSMSGRTVGATETTPLISACLPSLEVTAQRTPEAPLALEVQPVPS